MDVRDDAMTLTRLFNFQAVLTMIGLNKREYPRFPFRFAPLARVENPCHVDPTPADDRHERLEVQARRIFQIACEEVFDAVSQLSIFVSAVHCRTRVLNVKSEAKGIEKHIAEFDILGSVKQVLRSYLP
jgi:hypothetical protein